MESNPSAEYTTTLTGWLLSVVVTHHTNRSQNERIKLKKRKMSLPQLRFHLFFPKYKTETNLPQHGGKREHGHFFLTTTKLIKTGPTVTGLIRMKKKESKRNSFYFILLNLHFGIQHKDTQKKKG